MPKDYGDGAPEAAHRLASLEFIHLVPFHRTDAERAFYEFGGVVYRGTVPQGRLFAHAPLLPLAQEMCAGAGWTGRRVQIESISFDEEAEPGDLLAMGRALVSGLSGGQTAAIVKVVGPLAMLRAIDLALAAFPHEPIPIPEYKIGMTCWYEGSGRLKGQLVRVNSLFLPFSLRYLRV